MTAIDIKSLPYNPLTRTYTWPTGEQKEECWIHAHYRQIPPPTAAYMSAIDAWLEENVCHYPHHGNPA